MVGRQKLKENIPIERTLSWREYEAEYNTTRIGMKDPNAAMLGTSLDAETQEPVNGVYYDHFYKAYEGNENSWTRLRVLYDRDYVANYIYQLYENLGFIRGGEFVQPVYSAWTSEDGVLKQFASTEGLKRQELEWSAWAKEQDRKFPGTGYEFWYNTIRQARTGQTEDQKELVASNGGTKASKAK